MGRSECLRKESASIAWWNDWLIVSKWKLFFLSEKWDTGSGGRQPGFEAQLPLLQVCSFRCAP